jgi:hypothetical protein
MEPQPVLRPGDIPVALCLAVRPVLGYEALAQTLGISTSSAHRAVGRLQQAGLLLPGQRLVNREALREFLVHGARYAFPAVRGPETRGVPTAWSAPALENVLPKGPAVVWPSEHGSTRGEALVPLCETIPDASRRDPWLYEMLALVDALRIGQSRDRRIAAERLEQRLTELPR